MASVPSGDTPESSIHLPGIQGEAIAWWDIFGIPITNTILSTWVFMVILCGVLIVLQIALKGDALPRVRGIGLWIVARLDSFLHASIDNNAVSRRFFPMIAGTFVFILAANLISLLLEWLVLVSSDAWLKSYLRPINSDLSTTLALAASVIVLSQFIAIIHRGTLGWLSGYLFHFSGTSTVEKCINVFVGWLHLIGEFVRVLSLSFRLYGNIFAGVILITVMSFLLSKIAIAGIQLGQFALIPFWIFEIFVSLIQAFIFLTLTTIYVREASASHH